MPRVFIVISIFLLGVTYSSRAFAQNEVQQDMLSKINDLRAEGCNCSGRFMQPVPPLTWSATLLTSAMRHASDMKRHNYFSHYSQSGDDIGDRLDDVGYSWSYCGENLGSGQKSFDEVFRDWIKSQSHCMMLMNPEVEEVAVSSVGKYWVQHFGKRFDHEVFGSK